MHFKNRELDMHRSSPHPSVASPRGGAWAAGACVASSGPSATPCGRAPAGSGKGRLSARCVPAFEARRQKRPAFGWAKVGAVATSGTRGQVRPACPPVPSFVPSLTGVGLTLRSSGTRRQPASFLRGGAAMCRGLRRRGGRRAPQIRRWASQLPALTLRRNRGKSSLR